MSETKLSRPPIVIFGLKGSGKDTLREYLVAAFGPYHDSVRFSFADPLKAMVAALPVSGSEEGLYGPSENRQNSIGIKSDPQACIRCGALFNGWELWRNPATGEIACNPCGFLYPAEITWRLLCETLGTEWGRRLNVNLWAELWAHAVERYAQIGRRVITSDGRFENELLQAQRLGAYTIGLIRDSAREAAEKQRILHESEHFNLKYPEGDSARPHTFIVYNNGTLNDLEETAHLVVNEIYKYEEEGEPLSFHGRIRLGQR